MIMGGNVIQEKSYDFSKKIVLFCLSIQRNHKEYILSKQLLRSGTSIGANVEEGIGGFSKNDFRYKMSISYKEARESKYWIKLLRDTKLAPEQECNDLLNDVEDIIRILYKIVDSSK